MVIVMISADVKIIQIGGKFDPVIGSNYEDKNSKSLHITCSISAISFSQTSESNIAIGRKLKIPWQR